jgi:hypothetical protein
VESAVLGFLIQLIKAIFESLYMLFEGMPALEALRSWFGSGPGGGFPVGSLVLIAAALLLGLAGFALFLMFVRRGVLRLRRGSPPKGL